MTFEEAIAMPDGKFQVWDIDVKDGKCALMIFALTSGGAKQLAGQYVPVAERDAVVADLRARGFQVGATDYSCDFVWVAKADGIEVYDSKRRVFDAVGEHATLVDGSVVARADLVRVFAYATEDYIHRGVKGTLRSGEDVDLVAEVSLSAMGDPTYTRNELIYETVWCSKLGSAIATWAGTRFDDEV